MTKSSTRYCQPGYRRAPRRALFSQLLGTRETSKGESQTFLENRSDKNSFADLAREADFVQSSRCFSQTP
eukprot:1931812-Pyramimonas_sp.AAC.1